MMTYEEANAAHEADNAAQAAVNVAAFDDVFAEAAAEKIDVLALQAAWAEIEADLDKSDLA